jgi:uncharacterized protein YjbJ (UPF0337 family)
MDSDRITGAAEEFGGSVEATVGSLTGDAKTEADGKIDKAAGKARSMFGQVKDAARDAVSGIDASTVQGAARKISGNASDLTSQAGAYVGEQVRQQPVVALLSAAVFGALIGFMAGRAR